MEAPKNYFRHQLTVLKALGIKLDGTEERFCYKIYTFCICLTIFVSYGILEVMEAFYSYSNIDILVGVVSYLATDLLGLVKLFTFMYNREEVMEMLKSFETGVFLPDVKRGDNFEIKTLQKYVFIAKWQAYIYQFICAMVILFGIFGSIIERILNQHDPATWKMPFLSFSLFAINTSPNYEIAWFHQSAMRCIFATIVSSIDTLLGAILVHVTAQCVLLQNSAEKITPTLRNQRELREKLKNFVHYHRSILRLAGKFEKLFSNLILCEFFATLCILCFSMYHASMSDLFSRQAAQDFSYVSAISMQVFLCCFWGNEVAIQSEAVANACAKTDFVGTVVAFQKDLIFVIRRSQNPIILTAGKFTNLSLKTYVSILRASYSYYMVLRKNN